MSGPRDIGDLIREGLPKYPAPDALRDWAQGQARDAAMDPSSGVQEARAVAPSRGRALRPMALAAGLMIAAVLGWTGRASLELRSRAAPSQDALTIELVDTHVRSLMLEHLTDVRSTDQHTVKPWFAGKADFSPRVVELAAAGFPLVGGRMDYVQGHTAATLVYGRRRHVINLFTWPLRADAREQPDWSGGSRQGFALRHWTDEGMEYWAVSDVAAAELAAFQQAYVAAR